MKLSDNVYTMPGEYSPYLRSWPGWAEGKEAIVLLQEVVDFTAAVEKAPATSMRASCLKYATRLVYPLIFAIAPNRIGFECAPKS